MTQQATPLGEQLDTLLRRFDAAAERDPSAVAVRSDQLAMTYGTLAAASHELTERLAPLVTDRTGPVATLLEPGPHQVSAALAAMRIGYSVAPPDMIREMRIYASNSVNVLAKWGAVASLKDPAAQADVKQKTVTLRIIEGYADIVVDAAPCGGRVADSGVGRQRRAAEMELVADGARLVLDAGGMGVAIGGCGDVPSRHTGKEVVRRMCASRTREVAAR